MFLILCVRCWLLEFLGTRITYDVVVTFLNFGVVVVRECTGMFMSREWGSSCSVYTCECVMMPVLLRFGVTEDGSAARDLTEISKLYDLDTS